MDTNSDHSGTLSALGDEWDRVAKEVREIPVCGDRVRYALAIKPLLDLPSSASILEAGCGAGRILRVLTALGYEHLVGLEISEARLDEVKQRGRINAALVRSNEVPFASDSFDAIVSAAVIEHVNDPRTWLAELSRVTRTGGVVSIITDTYIWRWLKRMKLYQTIQPIDEAIWPSRLIQWGEEAGLELIDCGGFVNTPGQRFYFGKQILRFVPGTVSLQRWLSDDGPPAPPAQEVSSIVRAAKEFPASPRRNRWGCIWSYECYYWFRKR